MSSNRINAHAIAFFRSITRIESLFINAFVFSFFIAFYTIDPIVPLYIVGLGASESLLGLIISFSFFVQMILRIPTGIMCDKLGRWPFIGFGLSTLTLFLIFSTRISSPLWMCPILVFRALAIAVFPSASLAITSGTSSASKRRGKTVGGVLTTSGLAMICGPFLGSLLLQRLDYKQLFLVCAVFSISGLAIFIAKYRGIREEVDRGKKDFFPAFKRVTLSKNTLLLCLITLAFAIPFFGVLKTFFPIFAYKKLRFTSSAISLLYTVEGFATTVIRLPAGQFSDYIGRKKPMALGFLLMIVGLILLFATRTFLVIAFGMALIGLAWGIRMVTAISLLVDSVLPGDRAFGLGLLFTMIDAGSLTGSLTASAILPFFPMETLFYISVFIAITGIIPILYLKEMY